MIKIALSLLLMVGISVGLKCYHCDSRGPRPCPDEFDPNNATYVQTCTGDEDTCYKSMYCINLKLISKLHPIEST